MRTDIRRGTFEDVLHNSPPSIALLAHRLRAIITEVYPEVTEVPRPAEQHIDYGVGLNKGSEVFGYICPMKEYIRLGFYYGAWLPDRGGLLAGTGKRLRHIKLYTLSEAERPEIRELLKVAVSERKKAVGLE